MWSFRQHSSLLQESDQRRHLGVGISCMVYWTSTTAQHNHYNRLRKRADRGHGDERERDTKSRASWMCGTSLGGISVGTITIGGTAQPHPLLSLLGNMQHAIEHKIWNTMPPCIGSQKEPRSLTSSMPSVPLVLLVGVYVVPRFCPSGIFWDALFSCVPSSYDTIRCDEKTRNENISVQMKCCDVCKETKIMRFD